MYEGRNENDSKKVSMWVSIVYVCCECGSDYGKCANHKLPFRSMSRSEVEWIFKCIVYILLTLVLCMKVRPLYSLVALFCHFYQPQMLLATCLQRWGGINSVMLKHKLGQCMLAFVSSNPILWYVRFYQSLIIHLCILRED